MNPRITEIAQISAIISCEIFDELCDYNELSNKGGYHLTISLIAEWTIDYYYKTRNKQLDTLDQDSTIVKFSHKKLEQYKYGTI